MAHDPDDEEDTDRRPTAAELRRHRRTVPGGTPILPGEMDASEDEPAFEWPAAPSRRDAEVLRRANRDPGEPVSPAEISAIVHQLAARLREEFSRLLTQGPQDLTADLAELRKTVADHGQVIGPARSAASWALRGAVAAVLIVGGFLYKRGADEQHITDEIQALTDKVHRLETQIDHAPNQTKDRTP